MKLKQVMLYVKDFPALVDFYTKALDLHPVEATRSEGWIEFAEGFALHAIPEPIAKDIDIASPPLVREETPFKPIFQAGDLEATCSRVEAMGVPVQRYAWGAADCVDPEGNVFQICRT
jgi:catechol 2,3-dioxygenase-like lactoylglutathione lyase family enzyme